jgi:transposase
VEKRGLTDALRAAGVGSSEAWAHADEMRVGLRGQLRRVWAPKGVKVRQTVEMKYVWRYLVLAVEPSGALRWEWAERMKKEQIAPVVTRWKEAGLRALVWDNATSHRSQEVRDTGMTLIGLPPYSPELNPAERVFEELRRKVEGRVYGEIEKKVEAVEKELKALAADPERVQQLTRWEWIQQSLASLPPHFTAPPN